MLVVGGKCNWPHQFTLQADGTYFGSCKGGTPPFTGKLTNSEFDELSSRASKVVDADPSQAAVCNDSGAIAGTEIDLTLNNGATYTVFESSPIKKCYRGGTANVSALSDYIGMLMTKYFPKNTGGSTP